MAGSHLGSMFETNPKWLNPLECMFGYHIMVINPLWIMSSLLFSDFMSISFFYEAVEAMFFCSVVQKLYIVYLYMKVPIQNFILSCLRGSCLKTNPQWIQSVYLGINIMVINPLKYTMPVIFRLHVNIIFFFMKF